MLPILRDYKGSKTMKQEEEKLKKEVEQFYKNKKMKTTVSTLQQEADNFMNRKTKDGQEKQFRQD
tara:strand:- start:365 stop:559 length:195 start_codon:yes stop_codon:yes gene_type:complete